MKKVYGIFCVILFSLYANAQLFNSAFKIQSTNDDRGKQITTDNAGAVITTGYFNGTADFDPSVANTAQLTPNSGSFADVYIAKYDTSFNYIWAVQFGGSQDDFPYSLTTDSSNNIIVGGDYVPSSSRDGFVNKYDPNGNLVWSISIGGTGKDVVYGLKTDADNNVYVTGYFANTVDFDPSPSTYPLISNGGRDIFLAKYDSAGNFRWAFHVGGTMSTAYEEGGQDIAISGASIYLTGNFEGTTDFNPGIGTNNLVSNGSLDFFVAKYDTAGNYIWGLSAGSANKHDFSYGIDLDASENIYITGGFEETVDFDPSGLTATLVSASIMAHDIFVAKYNSSGVYQWAFQIGGNSSVDDDGFDIDVSSTGDIYVTGNFWGPADFDPSASTANINSSNNQIFIARYNSSGNYIWAFEIGSTSVSGPADNGFGIHQAGNGTLYLTGDFYGNADFDPGVAVASLSGTNQGHAFVASYNTTLFVGVNVIESDGNSFSVYPNPASEFFNIENNECEILLVQLFDLQGRHIKSFDVKTGIGPLHVSDISSGIYLLKAETSKGTSQQKVSISH